MDNSINISSLGFNQIKENLKAAIRENQNFTDFDYQGSNISILLDILALNAYHIGSYSNILANEQYLKTCKIRDIASRLAQSVGYLPQGNISAKGTVNITASAGVVITGEDIVATATINSNTFNFYLSEDLTLTTGESAEVSIIEGTRKQWDTIYIDESLELMDSNIDIDSIKVLVKEISGGAYVEYETIKNKRFTGIESDDKVFFLSEVDGVVNIAFGDDIIGKKINYGSDVRITYGITKGEIANGVSVFSAAVSNTTITTVAGTTGGTSPESIDSIKHNAPVTYSAQSRAVSMDDYKSILSNQYSEIESIKVYTDNNSYGKVFIAIKPHGGTIFSNLMKSKILDFVDDFSVPSTENIIVNPDYISVDVDISVLYDKSSMTSTPANLKSRIVAKASLFGDTVLEKFDNKLIHSQFVDSLQIVDNAIASIILKIKLFKTVSPSTTVDTIVDMDFGSQIDSQIQSPILSTEFEMTDSAKGKNVLCYISNDNNNLLNIYAIDSGVVYILHENIGTVKRTTGNVNFSLPATADDTQIKIYATPKNSGNANVESTDNQILIINEISTEVNIDE